MGFADALDITLVACLIYGLLFWFKRTKTAFVATGLLVLSFVYLLARVMNLMMTIWIFKGFFAVVIIAIVVIFQEELRHIFERIAVWSLRRGTSAQMPPRVIEIVVRAVSDFARDRIGALIVIQGRDPIERHIEGGWDLDGELSEALLESIFDSHSLGHDGAVLVANGRAAKFGCQLPLSKDFARIGNLGTRHAAALGLSERTDSLIVVVSEEKGSIALAQKGELKIVPDFTGLEKELERFVAEKVPKPPSQTFGDFFAHNLKEKTIALLFSVLVWLLFIGLGRR
jgi:uncharacterized protein (TIGR00159 family)